MTYLFGISAALLVVLAGARAVEMSRGAEVLRGVRDALDRGTLAVAGTIVRSVQRTILFVRHDILARLLHALSIVLLVLVRYLERHLARLVQFFRGTRDRRGGRTSEGLARLERTGTGGASGDTVSGMRYEEEASRP
jgi:hypothetical protein